MLFKFIIYAIVVYFLVRFIFNFLVPVLRFRRSAKSRFREMNDFFEQQNQQTHNSTKGSKKSFKKERKLEGEYIDYEEV